MNTHRMYRTPPRISNVFWATGFWSQCTRKLGTRKMKLPRAINEKKAPIQSIVRNIFPCQHLHDGAVGVHTQLMPITLPLRFHISTYGGRRPTASNMLAMTPRIIMGKLIPRSYNGCVVSDFLEHCKRSIALLSVSISKLLQRHRAQAI
jgi:hypothetical protein